MNTRNILIVWCVLHAVLALPTRATAADYYVSASGNDSSAGTSTSPWRTIAKVNTVNLHPGDRVLFEGGQTFHGMIYLDAADAGSSSQPVVVGSYGSGRAVISGDAGVGLYAYNSAGISVDNINFMGGAGNTGAGVMFYADLSGGARLDAVVLSNVDVSGFGNYGIVIGAWNGLTGYQNVRITNARSHDNVLGGIQIYGDVNAGGYANANLYIGHVSVYNNLGASGGTSPSGSGIVIGQVEGGTVEHCIAYNNGTFNTAGSGPVGIWAWGSTNITIQHNESHHNHTGGTDGGGFDLDGGTTRSVLQYNYSHDNDGAGYLLAGYPGARVNSQNVIRYNVSQNDGRKTVNGGIYIWDGAGNMTGNEVYNNTVFTSTSPYGASYAMVISTPVGDTHIRNNIFYSVGANTAPVSVAYGQRRVSFDNNDFFASGSSSPPIFGDAAHRGDMQVDPLLLAPGTAGTIDDTYSLASLANYLLQPGSPLRDTGVNLAAYGLNAGSSDYYGNTIPQGAGYEIGAHELPAQTSAFPPTVVTNAASSLTPSGAVLNATVSPGGPPTTTGFDYGSTTAYGSTVEGPTYSGSAAQSVSVRVSLACGQVYHFRARAANANGTAYGRDVSLTMPGCPPLVTTNQTTLQYGTSVEVTGTVNPNGTSTSAVFEYGLTPAYGSFTNASPSPGIGDAPVPVRAFLTDLRCGTPYHFRLVATNANGAGFGSDATLVAGCDVGQAPQRGVIGDQDGDRRADLTVYRPSTGAWWTLQSGGNFATYAERGWGLPNDVPVPGDYDGDGKLDLTVYRPSTGAWWICWSSTNFAPSAAYVWGGGGDRPVPADYDGDGRTDIAVYRPSTAEWLILRSSTDFTVSASVGWGLPDDVPVPGDYDGDGKADPAIYRPSTGGWWMLKSSANYLAGVNRPWGLAGDVPVPADYDGDGRTDIAVYRPTTGGWWVLTSMSNFSAYAVYPWGLTTDRAVPADYDGDGKADVAVYRPGTGGWWILTSRTGFATYDWYGWGMVGDVPISQRP